jgi:hypothetical protein
MKELSSVPPLLDPKTNKKQDRIPLVGILEYNAFTQNYKKQRSSADFRKFQKVVAARFEGVLFGELHWKRDTVRGIEKLV